MNDQLIQQNLPYIVLGIFVAWMLWRRMVAPMLSGVKSMNGVDYMSFRNQKHTLVDVRTAGEWKSAHAPNAMHVPLSDLGSMMNRIPMDHPVVVICASGNRSAVAATQMAKSGYAEVYNFSGGMGAWQRAGLPIK